MTPTSMDVTAGAACVLSVFLREPGFQGQTKNRLAAAAEAHADGEVPLY